MMSTSIATRNPSNRINIKSRSDRIHLDPVHRQNWMEKQSFSPLKPLPEINMIKRQSFLLLLSLILIPFTNCKLINEFYIRTFPEDISINFPEGRVINCLSNCPDKGCNCFRISRDVSNTNCDYEMIDMPKNDKFIYYAVDRYNSTFTEGKNLVDLKKVTKSSGIEPIDKPSTTHPWIQFDLSKEFTITGIQIRSNKEWTMSEIRVGKQPITVTFNDQPFTDNQLCEKKESGRRNYNGNELIPCKPCPLVGRYVTIQKQQHSQDDYSLSPDSVQIFGFETL